MVQLVGGLEGGNVCEKERDSVEYMIFFIFGSAQCREYYYLYGAKKFPTNIEYI